MKINHFLKQIGIPSALFIFCFLFLTGTTQADSIKVRIKASEADIRLKPANISPVVGKALLGAILDAERKLGDWYLVSLPPDENGFIVSGYIHKDFVEIVEEVMDVPEKKPKKPARTARQPEQIKETPSPQPTRERKFHIKGIIGFGGGFDKIETGIYQKSWITDDWREVIILPGGGISAEAILGYRFIPSLMLELGIAYQSSGTSIKDTGEELHFQRYPLTVTLIHEFKSKGSILFYVGGGAGFYLSPRFYLKISGVEIEVKYKPSPGFHGLIGISSNTRNKGLFYFGEIRFAGIMNYEWETATLDGFAAIPSDEYAKLTGKGIYVYFGIGYAF